MLFGDLGYHSGYHTPPAQRPHGALIAVLRAEYDDHGRRVVRPPGERPAVRSVEIPAADATVLPDRPDLRRGDRQVRRPFEARVRARNDDLQVLRQALQPLDQVCYRQCAASPGPTIRAAKGDAKLTAVLESMWAQWLTVE